MTSRLLPLLAFLTLLFLPSAHALEKPHTRAFLLSESASIQPGKPFTVGVRLVMDPHWHTYWKNPGDSGLATTITWTLPPGFSAGPIQWPTPQRISTPPLMSYGYEGETMLLTTIQAPADLKPGTTVNIAAAVDWLECSDICVPGAAKLKLTLPVKTEAPKPFSAENEKLFALTHADIANPETRTQDATTIPSPIRTATANGDQKRWWLTITFAEALPHSTHVYFFADSPEIVESAAPQIAKIDGPTLILELTRPVASPPLKELSGLLVITNKSDEAVFALTAPVTSINTAKVSISTPANPTLILSLIFAFVGGLILNLMPCVLPVLSLKVLSLVQRAGDDHRAAAKHGVAFTLGVVLSFWVLAGILLALRAAGQQLGWGFQMQSPPFVFALIVIFFAFALNLFGLFEVGTSLVGVDSTAARKGGLAGSFGMGALATIAATPCTAPFMGAALGFAVAQSALTAFLVFTALALGMAAPYLALALFPALLKFVPKPGAWMESFKQFLGFLLLGTVVFLVWVFGQQLGMDAVAALLGVLLVFGVAAWIYGRWTAPTRADKTRRIAALLAGILLGCSIYTGIKVSLNVPPDTAHSTSDIWIPYSAEKLTSLRAEGKPVFLDFTAAWCLSCKVNEAVALNTDAVQAKFRAKGVVLMKGDWTRRDPAITAALAEFGRNGVPLYVLYSADQSVAPQVLPEVLTPGIVLDALEKLK